MVKVLMKITMSEVQIIGVKVLSLFDGMACGMLAMQKAGIEVDEYTAFEIDKYAIKTATHNFPTIKECGDVFSTDFSKYKGVDYLVGGSPCTYWSIAQKNNRETEASGLGWELFSHYVRALRESQPRYFVYENNKSMSKAIRESITETFGFEPICIDAALVSAQKRQRLYWVGKRDADGTYSRVDVKQPEDRGIILKDILVSGEDLTSNEKSWVLTASYDGAVPWNTIERNQRNMVAEPVLFNVPHGYNKGGIKYKKTPTLTANGSWIHNNCVSEPVNTTGNGKSQTLKAQYAHTNVRNICCYSSTYGATGVAEPVNTTADGKAQCLRATYYKDGIRNLVGNNVDRKTCVAIPVEFDGDVPTKAISYTDGKTYTVYEVKDGLVTIKGKQYPIKLADGFYIFRKLTVLECKRLQTVSEYYEFPVSDTQAYKMLGNGWCVDVIVHILSFTVENL